MMTTNYKAYSYVGFSTSLLPPFWVNLNKKSYYFEKKGIYSKKGQRENLINCI
jgi:hypothetical protein